MKNKPSKMKKHYYYLGIDINYKDAPFTSRPFYALASFFEMIARTNEFVDEYKDYSKRKALPRWYHKADFIINHTILIPFYLIWAVIFGKAHSYNWKIDKPNEK